MLTLNDTALEDKYAIWIIKINLDADGYLYFADCEDKITLSGIDFDGKVILQDSFSSIVKDIDVVNGGSIGQVGNAQMGIARYTSYVGVSNFQNDFYPATSKPLLTSKTVEIGLLWTGATTTGEITWIEQYYVEHYFYNDSQMLLSLIAYDELTATQIPGYVIQKDFNNGISYFTDAPDESYGQAIPIIYGELNYIDADIYLKYSNYLVTPTVRIDKTRYKFIAASHKCSSVYIYSLYRYLESADTIMQLYGNDSTYVYANSQVGAWIELGDGITRILGEIYLQAKRINRDSVFTETISDDAYDKDSATYGNIAMNSTIAFQLGIDTTQSELGVNTGVRNDVVFYVDWSSSDANTQNIRVQYYHPGSIGGSLAGYSTLYQDDSTIGRKTIGFAFGDGNYDYASNPTKWEDDPRWDIGELEYIYLTVWNKNTSTASIKIFNCYLKISNIDIYTKVPDIIKVYYPKPKINQIMGQIR